MELVFVLNGAFPKLAFGEIKAFLPSARLAWHPFLARAEAGGFDFERLGLTRLGGRVFWEGRWSGFYAEKKLASFRSYGVEVSKLGCDRSSLRIKRLVGDRIRGRALLSSPSHTVLAVAGEKNLVLAEKMFEINNKVFYERRNQNRPFSHPTGLDPRLARALVNLSGLKKGVLLDPFCGAGGILLEAGLLGLKVVGVDVDGKMVKGCGENLSHFGIKSRLFNENAFDFSYEADAVVTDLPYGRGSRVAGENFHERALEAVERCLSGRRAVVVADRDLRKKTGMFCAEFYGIRVHRSLTRRVHVFEKN